MQNDTTEAARRGGTRGKAALTLAALLGSGLLLSACNTTAGAGKDVSAIGNAVSNGANDVKQGM